MVNGPVSFSGLVSGLNTQSIINAEMAVYEQPLNNLQTEQSTINTKITDYQAINTQLLSLQQECRRMGGILEDFLKFARAGQPELVPCDLNQVVREFLEFYQPEAGANGIEISPHLGADLPEVRIEIDAQAMTSARRRSAKG